MRVLLVLMCLPSTAEARPFWRSKAVEPPPPEAVAVAPTPPVDPVDPGPGGYPYARSLPGLDGASTTLDLEALTTVRSVFRVEVDTSAVDTITADNRDLVARHLAADPRWRLVEHDGVLVAYARQAVDEQLIGSPDGFWMDDTTAVRVGIRLDPWPDDSAWAQNPLVHHAPASPEALNIESFVLREEPWKSWTATALSIDGSTASLDIYEAGTESTRAHTGTALGTSLDLLRIVVPHASRVTTKGYVDFALPSGEPASGTPVVAVSTPAPGTLNIEARVNPGAPGWTWVRLLDDQLQPWESEAVGLATREQVGWSARPEQLFLLQSTFILPNSTALPTTAEVWFQPHDGEPVRLHEQALHPPTEAPAASPP